MTLPILLYPDPRLKLVAEPVRVFDAALAELCTNLLETMYENEGVGLAANQVNIPQRVIAIDISEEQDEGVCYINPVITHKSGSSLEEEGCLSFPGIYAKVSRASEITVEYVNVAGEPQTLTASGLLALCIQHEVDHLDGITFYDHLSSLKKKLLRDKIAKQRERAS